jgi:hypothetical protein
LTISTGGFIYVGDKTHSYSWLLADSQYIAPLMANFDTLQNQSTILYADDGNRMIVEWKDVILRDNREGFSFLMTSPKRAKTYWHMGINGKKIAKISN